VTSLKMTVGAQFRLHCETILLGQTHGSPFVDKQYRVVCLLTRR